MTGLGEGAPSAQAESLGLDGGTPWIGERAVMVVGRE